MKQHDEHTQPIPAIRLADGARLSNSSITGNVVNGGPLLEVGGAEIVNTEIERNRVTQVVDRARRASVLEIVSVVAAVVVAVAAVVALFVS